MTSLRLGLGELRRVTAGPRARITIVVLLLLPVLFGAGAWFVNDDPYANLRNVSAAVVVDDSGSRDTDGNAVMAGQQVADELVAGDMFDWTSTDAEAAAAGVRDGTYAFSLTVPPDFSAALTSSATFDPAQTQLRLVTNEASTYVSETIADEVTGQVRTALATQLGTEAADNFLLGISDTRNGLLQATSGASTLLEEVQKATAATKAVTGGAEELGSTARNLREGIEEGLTTLEEIPTRLEELAASAEDTRPAEAAVRDIRSSADAGVDAMTAFGPELRELLREQGLGNAQINEVMGAYAGARDDVREAGAGVRGALDNLDSPAINQIADESAAIAEDFTAAVEGFEESVNQAGALGRSTEALSSGAGQLARTLDGVDESGAALRDNLQASADKIPALDGKSRDTLALAIGSPVQVSSITPEATTFGAGLAPMLIALAAWIGAYVLFLVLRPLSSRAIAANQSSLRVAVSGWLPSAALVGVQMILVALAVTAAVGTEAANLPATLAFTLLIAASFAAIVHCLTAWFGRTGQLAALVLLGLQVFVSGGPFPWETIPSGLHVLHHALPLPHAVDALRQLMYGGPTSAVGLAAVVLLGYLVAALGLTAVAARRHGVWSLQRFRPELAV